MIVKCFRRDSFSFILMDNHFRIMQYILELVTITLLTEGVSSVLGVSTVWQETILPNNPFVSIWNAPSEGCGKHFGVTLNLSYFDIVANKNETFEGDEIVIFYNLGIFPHYTRDNKTVNGGIPQLGNLTVHLEKVKNDIDMYIPKLTFSGLAVIDWEAWRPIYERNNYNSVMRIYIRESESLVRREHPDWSEDKIKRKAAEDFETAAQEFMLEALILSQKLRPYGKWGYYGFPNCFNHKLGEKECTNRTKFDNDRLSWLFTNSGAILPSIYLAENFGTVDDRKIYVFGQLTEALRVRGNNSRAAILPYSLFRYRDTGNLYMMADLKNAIQQSMDAGLAGVALWGSSASFRTKSQCEATRDYIDDILGPFVKSITLFALNCSSTVCHSHGRCVRSVWVSGGRHKPTNITERKNYYMNVSNYKSLFKIWDFVQHLITFLLTPLVTLGDTVQTTKGNNPYFEESLSNYEANILSGNAKNQRIDDFDEFVCRCYSGWSGKFCQNRLF